MNKIVSQAAAALGVLCCFFAVSCSKVMGYSVVLWSDPEKKISDGDIVPVYIKSNISQTYVIDAAGEGMKTEVPLWQLTEPAPLKHAEKEALRYAEYRNQYARVAADGLPVRADTDNTARQVYRLRKDEIIKVLYKGEGAPVMSGSEALPGDWLRVLTADGSEGWCYSYNLRLFDMTDDQMPAAETEMPAKSEEEDAVLQTVFSDRWYPEEYGDMIRTRRIDLSRMKSEYGFFADAQNKQIKLALRDIMQVYTYSGIKKTSGSQYSFTGTPVAVTVRGDSYIVVHHADEKGMPKADGFITIPESVDNLIAAERDRRAQEFNKLLRLGPSFASGNYGRVSFSEGGAFTWSGYRLLVPGVIPRQAGGAGSVSFSVFLSKALAEDYDGAMEFHFDGSAQPVYFLYKLRENGLTLETVGSSYVRENTILQRDPNPVVMFFSKQ